MQSGPVAGTTLSAQTAHIRWMWTRAARGRVTTTVAPRLMVARLRNTKSRYGYGPSPTPALRTTALRTPAQRTPALDKPQRKSRQRSFVALKMTQRGRWLAPNRLG